ncbi:phage/plasmid replication protein [Nitrosomonas sp.]|uniref:phage/plasmid replication domain-containing protein n=1 Tax=Nitrosomonas sp. TaxID=42353 RepID=UPI002848ABA2|nr:phage/plasmid replication protein [Nitrosomonas sp.]MDR4513150.1 phage/plasmid replication protein [Nitrosomonas sp.]
MSKIPFFVDYLTIRQSHVSGGLPIINGGRVVRVDADGEIEYVLDTRQGLEGSFDSRVELRCDGHTVEFSGNISRYGRQDNLFGYSFTETIQKINQLIESFGLPPFTAGEFFGYTDSGWTYSGARISRIDITCNYATGSMLDSEALLRNMAGHHIGRQKGSLSVNGATVEYGRGSKYVYGKLYCKTTELKRHKSRKSGQHVSEEVINYCQQVGVVREEFTLKSRFLTQNGLAYLGAITDEKLAEVYMNRSQLQRLEQVSYDNFSHLSPRLRATYVSWKYGYPLELSKSAFYRHRSELLKYGIDISIPNNVHTLPIRVKTIELSALNAPDWYQQKYA